MTLVQAEGYNPDTLDRRGRGAVARSAPDPQDGEVLHSGTGPDRRRPVRPEHPGLEAGGDGGARLAGLWAPVRRAGRAPQLRGRRRHDEQDQRADGDAYRLHRRADHGRAADPVTDAKPPPRAAFERRPDRTASLEGTCGESQRGGAHRRPSFDAKSPGSGRPRHRRFGEGRQYRRPSSRVSPSRAQR
jgi:hypothetical protein